MIVLSCTQAMNRITLIFALFFLASAAVADPNAEVRCREIAFSQSVESKDIKAFRAILDDDARFVGSS